MSELQIIGAPQSNYVWVSRIACHEKGVPYTLVPAMPHTPEIDAIHPLGKIPALRHGDLTLAESRAICFYIDHAFDGPPLVSRDPAEGARTEQWISIVNTHFDVLVARPYVGAYFFPGTSDGSRAIVESALPKLETQFAMLDRAVARRQYLHLGRYECAADAVLSPPFARERRNAAAECGPGGLLRAPHGASQRQRSGSAAVPRPLVLGCRRLMRRLGHALHVSGLQPRERLRRGLAPR